MNTNKLIMATGFLVSANATSTQSKNIFDDIGEWFENDFVDFWEEDFVGAFEDLGEWFETDFVDFWEDDFVDFWTQDLTNFVLEDIPEFFTEDLPDGFEYIGGEFLYLLTLGHD